MNQEEFNTKEGKGKHLCLWERREIEKALQRGASIRSIAKVLKRSPSTISREIKRGTVKQRKIKRYVSSNPEDPGYSEYEAYFADTGQSAARNNTGRRGGKYKLFEDPELMRRIENEIIINRYSPDSILGGLKRNGHTFKTMVCTKTVYNYIELGLMKVKNMDLILKPRLRVRKRIVRQRKRVLGTSIEQRPQVVSERQEFGHFEGDSVVGANGKSSILTLVERVTGNGFILAVKDGKAESSATAINELQTALGKDIIKSITFDNGSEFARCHELETAVYFAHPYSAYERGINENFNGIVRRYIPKGKDMSCYTQADLNRIANTINNLPRKRLAYQTAAEAFAAELENVSSYP